MTDLVHLLRWAPASDGWMADQGFMDWQCYCGADVSVTWMTCSPLLDTNEPITAHQPNSSAWQLVCHEGHTLLLCHELSDDTSADTFEAPTTAQIVGRLASPDDVAAWASHVQPPPPWKAS